SMPPRYARAKLTALLAGVLLAPGLARAEVVILGGRIILGGPPPGYPPPGSPLDTGQGNYPGGAGAGVPGYGYPPNYTSNWPTPREALRNPPTCPARPAAPPSDPPQAAPAPEAATAAVLRVLLPADAELFVADSPTSQRGPERLFVTPPLEGGRGLHY